MSTDVRVTAISATPVKGLRIATLERAMLERGGVRDDRRFYLIEQRGRMVNGKHLGALSEVTAALDDKHRLKLGFPDGTEVAGAIEYGETLNTRFFSQERAARVIEGPFAAALSQHAGEQLRLVEPADGVSGIDRGARGAVSLISRGSLAALASAAGNEAIDARRFRMTLELDGLEAFGEDEWIGRALRVGETTLKLVGNVGRCIVTSRHPESGAVDLPTLDLLRELRAGAATTEPLPFGVYGEVLAPGIVCVGDRVEPAIG